MSCASMSCNTAKSGAAPCTAPVHDSSTAGFSLIEGLVGVALLGLLSALILQCLHLAGTVAGQQRAGAVQLEDVVAAQRVLRHSIERLRPMPRLDAAGAVVEARGSEGVFTYIAPPSAGFAPAALQRFRLTRTATGDLVLYAASIRAAGTDRSGMDLTDWQPLTVLRGVRGLSISYFGADVSGANRGWQNTWWDRSRPPELVRIRVTFAPGDRRIWPDLIIRPRATVHGTCRIESRTGDCEVRI